MATPTIEIRPFTNEHVSIRSPKSFAETKARLESLAPGSTTIFTVQGLQEGNHGEAGDYVVERASPKSEAANAAAPDRDAQDIPAKEPLAWVGGDAAILRIAALWLAYSMTSMIRRLCGSTISTSSPISVY